MKRGTWPGPAGSKLPNLEDEEQPSGLLRQRLEGQTSWLLAVVGPKRGRKKDQKISRGLPYPTLPPIAMGKDLWPGWGLRDQV